MAERDRSKILNHKVTLIDKGPPTLYKLDFKETVFSKSQTRKCEVGSPKKVFAKKEKVILVVGATGSGKSTLINAMVNYIFGIEFEDDYRLKLIEEPKVSQAHSQTQLITAYTIHHYEEFKVSYTLTIIDTPGFGDTRGIQKDKAITQQIKDFFTSSSGIDHLDAVCFVVQSALPRLTPTQTHIFDSILSLFGKDIEENIFMMLTFADGQSPQVLASLKEAGLPFKKERWFKFNNSALYANDEEDDDENTDEEKDEDEEFDKMSWKMGFINLKKFFVNLVRVTPVSLLLTQEVLKERSQLEVYIDGIQSHIHLGMNRLQQTEIQVLKDRTSEIERNKNFEYQVEEDVADLTPITPGTYTTNCITCKKTCHYPCMIKDDSQKNHCWAMTDEECRICPNNCHWSVHHNLPHKYDINRKTVTKTSQKLKERYDVAMKGKGTAEKLVQELSEDFKAIQFKVLGLIEEMRLSLQRLQEIALKPNPLTTVEYIDLLILAERQEKKDGWFERTEQLQGIRVRAQCMMQLVHEGYDPFEKEAEKLPPEYKTGPVASVINWFSSKKFNLTKWFK